MAFDVYCKYYSALGGPPNGVTCSCKKEHETCPGPHECTDYRHFKSKDEVRYYRDEPILDFGAGGAAWYRVD